MINNLKDFKKTSKKLQSILQTFEIRTPEAFKLSNSASLNFMARILGYENYNTIKTVLEKDFSKGKKMFINIREKDGVLYQDGNDAGVPKSNFGDFRLGLNQIIRIKFYEEDKKIYFFLLNEEWFELSFKKNAMGEYHRIKRLIDENTLELTDKTK
jgi:hypothetical protein